ncbi:YoaK family protein [Streptomyces sp. NPDC050485]|uniref:YoaK family protein n=1 Tax=Streptomyces sp. NPDC050485 TaxID=3365617 RepID=UPI00379A4292
MSSANTTTSPAGENEPALLVLSAASGATDAFAFLCLGKVFAGVMTGNLVLVGASVGAGDRDVAPRALTALVGYALGAAGAAVAGHRITPRLLLMAETVLLALAAAGWSLGLGRSLGSQLVLLVAVSLAMGVQARAWGTPTTYFTGTFTGLAGRLAKRAPRRSDRWVAARLAAVVAGAAAGSLTAWCWSPVTGAVAALLCAAALATRLPQYASPQG